MVPRSLCPKAVVAKTNIAKARPNCFIRIDITDSSIRGMGWNVGPFRSNPANVLSSETGKQRLLCTYWRSRLALHHESYLSAAGGRAGPFQQDIWVY